MDKMLEKSDVQEAQLWRANAYSVLGNLLAAPPSPDVLAQIARINISDQDSEGELLSVWSRGI